MKLKLANHSTFPKIGEKDNEHELRRAYHSFDRQKITLEEVKKVQKEVVRETIKFQEKAGLDIVTDGLISWNDPVSHIMKNLEGVEIGGLLRFFDTNFYFRQPIIKGNLRSKVPLIKDEISFLVQSSKQETKAVLTGPYTLSLLSKIETSFYKGRKEIASQLTDVLVQGIAELSTLGVNHIQIEEPAFILETPDWKWVGSVFKKFSSQKKKSKGRAPKLWLSLYFGDAAPLYNKLQELDVDVLSLDCTYSKTLLEQIRNNGSEKELALGLVDGRNTKLENTKEIASLLHSLDAVWKNKTFYLTPSSGLEYLPKDRAIQKLELLRNIQHEYQKGA